MKLSANKPCPCQSGKKAKKCCAPILKGRPAPTPEALMRSRYTAYATGNVNYIMKTTHPDGDHYREDKDAWLDDINVFCRECSFNGLKVENAETQDTKGWVTFHANISRGNEDLSFTERSFFVLENGQWLYHSAASTDA